MLNFIKNNRNIIIASLISLVLGIIIFGIYFGFAIINPLNVDWIYSAHPDITQHQIGFQYYRYAPWSFPLGLFNTLSFPIYTSILNTDSIPLIAIPLKLLSPILPHEFQYMGLWVVSCFMLISFFGMLIAKKYTDNSILGYTSAILVGLLFSTLPIIPIFSFWHSTLAAHYLLLICYIPFVYDKMTFKQAMWLYGIMGFVFGAVHGYLLVMAAIITLFYSVMMVIKTKNYKYASVFLLFFILASCSMYIVGGLNMNAAMQEDTLSYDSFNLNSFFNSFNYCRLFHDIPVRPMGDGAGQIMGFSYFGIGIIALVLLSLTTFLIDLIKKRIKINDKAKFYTILSLIIFSIIIALSPRVTFNDIILFEIPYPDFMVNIWSIFRATGRYIWIASYTILILAFSYILKRFKLKTTILFLTAAIFLQVFDVVTVLHAAKESNFKVNQDVVLAQKLWGHLFEKNKIENINFDEQINNLAGKVSILAFIYPIEKSASDYNAKTNNFYFARPLIGVNKQYRNSLKHAKDSDLYIVSNREGLARVYIYSPIRYFYQINGFIVARTVPIEGMEGYREFRPVSINAANFDNILMY